MVRDLTTVERELGFRYELPDGGHYQEVCPNAGARSSAWRRARCGSST